MNLAPVTAFGKVCARPCGQCPFARRTRAGDIGNSDPTVYLGQVVGPYFLPCHKSPGYEIDRGRMDHLQCAGAAVFRTHLEEGGFMFAQLPHQLARLPANHAEIFSTPVEFLSHHGRMTKSGAEDFLKENPSVRCSNVSSAESPTCFVTSLPLMPKTIEFVCKGDNVRIATEGFKGSACEAITETFTAKLGIQKSNERTAEFYEKPLDNEIQQGLS